MTDAWTQVGLEDDGSGELVTVAQLRERCRTQLNISRMLAHEEVTRIFDELAAQRAAEFDRLELLLSGREPS